MLDASVPAPATVPATSAATPIALPTRAAVDPRLILSLAAVYLIWSSTYLAIRIVITELPALLSAGSRYFVAGLVLLVLARRRGSPWPSADQWLRVVPSGALLFLCGNGFVVIAEQTVTSGGAAVVCATMPLWTGVLAAISGERPSWREWLSLTIGFVGVLVLMGGPSLQGDPLHLVLVMLSPMCWALASVISRRQFRAWGTGALMASAMQMLVGGAILMAVGGARGEPLPLHASAGPWLALGYLAVFGSLIGFTAYNWLLRNARPIVATSYAYVNPILAVLIGAVLYGEPLGWTTLLANALIVGAIALALTRSGARPPRPATEPPSPRGGDLRTGAAGKMPASRSTEGGNQGLPPSEPPSPRGGDLRTGAAGKMPASRSTEGGNQGLPPSEPGTRTVRTA